MNFSQVNRSLCTFAYVGSIDDTASSMMDTSLDWEPTTIAADEYEMLAVAMAMCTISDDECDQDGDDMMMDTDMDTMMDRDMDLDVSRRSAIPLDVEDMMDETPYNSSMMYRGTKRSLSDINDNSNVMTCPPQKRRRRTAL